MLHTINGSLISSVECKELIYCLAYTTAPEGRAVNALAGGLSTGIIRLWSSWDLQVCDYSSSLIIHLYTAWHTPQHQREGQ